MDIIVFVIIILAIGCGCVSIFHTLNMLFAYQRELRTQHRQMMENKKPPTKRPPPPNITIGF